MPGLTDQEKREIIRYIEEDKPLPDKYRFLLFENNGDVELVWKGKSGTICDVVLPFLTIERNDEPLKEKSPEYDYKSGMFTVDNPYRQDKEWRNKLIWGDNLLILSSLKNGPMREEIERQGGLKLIYIDPPFDAGANFSVDIKIGADAKNSTILTEIAYRDTWGKGAASFITMIYERLKLMRDLLAEDGSIYVHCDWRSNSFMRLLLDSIFNFHVNEVIWHYTGGGRSEKYFSKKHDSIFIYTKSEKFIFNKDSIRIPYKETSAYAKGGIVSQSGKRYMPNPLGTLPDDVWDIPIINPLANERTGYPTQKPEALLERIIKASTYEGDLIADFFCGSGTLPAVAERLGRKWLAADLGKFAIHSTRKRLLGVQRQLKKEGRPYRAFEVLNMGRYERQYHAGAKKDLPDEGKKRQLEEHKPAFLDMILRAYKAEKLKCPSVFHGKKRGRMVVVGPIDHPVSRQFLADIILECQKHRIPSVDVLCFEYEIGLFPHILEEALNGGIDIIPRVIPKDIFDRRAVDSEQVMFPPVAHIEAMPHYRDNMVAVELKGFSVYCSQDSIGEAKSPPKMGKSKIVVDAGQIVKVSRDNKGIIHSERLTRDWTDWIDYWSVDYDFGSKGGVIRINDGATGDFVEQWAGNYIFGNEWQSFRTRQNRKLELFSAWREMTPGRHKVAVKVVDIFGNDTMSIVAVYVKGKEC